MSPTIYQNFKTYYNYGSFRKFTWPRVFPQIVHGFKIHPKSHPLSVNRWVRSRWQYCCEQSSRYQQQWVQLIRQSGGKRKLKTLTCAVDAGGSYPGVVTGGAQNRVEHLFLLFSVVDFLIVTPAFTTMKLATVLKQLLFLDINYYKKWKWKNFYLQ